MHELSLAGLGQTQQLRERNKQRQWREGAHREVEAHFQQVAALVLQHVAQQAAVKLGELLLQGCQLGGVLRCTQGRSSVMASWARLSW